LALRQAGFALCGGGDQLALSNDSVQLDPSRTQSQALPRPTLRQRFANISVLGGAIVLLLAASAIVQAIGYVSSGLAMPDALTAAPALLGIILSLPTVLGNAPVRRWSGFAISFGVTLLVYLIAVAYSGFTVAGFKAVLQIALAVGCIFIGFATGLQERSRRFIDRAIVITCIALSLFLILVLLMFPHGDFRPKNIIGSELMYLALLLVAARFDYTGKLSSIRLLAFFLIGAGLVAGHRTVFGLGVGAFVLDKLLPRFRSSFIHRSVILATCGLSVFIVFMYLNIDSLPIFSVWNRLAQEYSGRQVSSGRQLLWPSIWEQIQRAPIFGHGFSLAASQITGQNLSTHNAFFMILLQVGWVGLIPVLCMLYALVAKGLSGDYTQWRTLFTITMVIVIINSTFETELIQNNFRVSVLLWLALGFIYSRIRFARVPAIQ
jgi:O-antigen ligase